jgi:toxin ParE1/3/4
VAQVIWSEPAIHEFERIVDVIAMENPIAAQRWAVRLSRNVDKLEYFPELGRPLAELPGQSVRELLVAPCRVIYGHDGGRVHILHLIRYEQYLDMHTLLGMVTEDDEPYPILSATP